MGICLIDQLRVEGTKERVEGVFTLYRFTSASVVTTRGDRYWFSRWEVFRYLYYVLNAPLYSATISPMVLQ